MPQMKCGDGCCNVGLGNEACDVGLHVPHHIDAERVHAQLNRLSPTRLNSLARSHFFGLARLDGGAGRTLRPTRSATDSRLAAARDLCPGAEDRLRALPLVAATTRGLTTDA